MNESLNIALFEWLATFLVLAAATAVLLKLSVRSDLIKGLALGLCAIVPLLPYEGLFVSQYFLTITGHISVTSMVLLAGVILREITGKSFWRPGERRLILAGVAVASILIFPAAFGLIRYDGYLFGYMSAPFAVVLFALAIAAALTKRHLAFLTLVAAAAAFQLHLLASNNLWDYLLDPSLAIVAFAVTVWNGARSLLSNRSSTRSAAESR